MVVEISEYEVVVTDGKERGVSIAQHRIGKIGSAIIRLALRATVRGRMIQRADTLWIVSDRSYWRGNDPAEAYIRKLKASQIAEQKKYSEPDAMNQSENQGTDQGSEGRCIQNAGNTHRS